MISAGSANLEARDNKNMNKLTDEQITAINQIEGKVCLKAGAGTGKTLVLTNRYIKILKTLLKEGYVLEDAIMSIVAVTFTKKAANQMRTKIKENLTEFSNMAAVLSGAYISTIDAFCLRLLRENAFLVGIDPDFVIMEEIESKLLFLEEARNVFNTRDLPAISFNVSMDFFLREVYSFIRRLKNNAINPVMFKENIKKINDLDEKKKLGEIIFCLYAAYEERLKKENKFDFQSILLAGLSLLENKQIKEKYKDFFKYILVDEYQDTTFLQDKLLRELSSYSGNYFAVGDVNQSIYAFRDARPENMMNFDRETKKEGKSLSLTSNFRSFDEILKLSNQCFQGQMPYFQPLYSGRNKDSLCCEINLAGSAEEEAEFISQRILGLLESDSGSLQCKDIVILFRGIRNIGIYEEILYKHHLPFITVGGSGYYDRPEIKDIISLLGVINNPFDDINLVRVLRGPIYRIGNSTLQKLANLRPGEEMEDKDIIGKGNYPIYDALGKVQSLNVGDEEKASLRRLREFIDEFIYQKNKLPLGRFLYCLIQNSGYTSYVQTLSPIERKRSLANIDKFYQLVCRFEERNLIPVLEDFIAYLKEVINQETMESEENHEIEDVIQLMTIHQAKGLEFTVVFVANISPDSFPPRSRTPRYYFDAKEGFLCKDIKEEEEKIKKKNKERFSCEEERLLYVAMTRAKKRLILSGRIKEDGKGKRRKSRFMDYFFKMQEDKLILKEEYGELLIEANKVFPIKEEWREKKYKGYSFNPEQKINREEIVRHLDFKYCSSEEKETKKSFSVTQLAVFDQCPLQYKYRYEIGVLANSKPNENLNTGKIDETVLGMIMHKILQEFTLFGKQEKWDDKKIFSRFKKLAKTYGIASEDADSLYNAQIQEIFNKIIKSDYNPSCKKTKAVEKSFHLNLNGFLIKGTIDRIDEQDNGSFEIIDYKMSKSINIDRYDFSMQLYGIGAERVLGLKPVDKTTLYSLRQGQGFSLEIKPTEEILKKAERIIAQITRSEYGISEKKECAFCGFKAICPKAIIKPVVKEE